MQRTDPPDGDAPGSALDGALLDGRYRVVSALGAGGMATVYLAQDERLDRSVVVKTPHPALAVEKDFRARFDREIRNLTQIEHPHVLKVHDTGSFRDLPYAVMQHLSGGSLADRLRAGGGRQRAQDVLPWLLQVADALDHIHARGFVHRDVKPGNILYDDAGNVVVADFGIAKAMGRVETGITATGVTPGSPGYMAPEVFKGGELGPAYDQYSLAVCAYEALCGRLPYPGETPLELLAGLMSTSAADLSPLVPEIPPEATAAVMRALARDPAMRFATCTEFAKTFQTALGVPTMQVFPERFRRALRRRRWMRAGIAAVALGAAAAMGAGAASLTRRDAPSSSPPDSLRTGTAPSASSGVLSTVPVWELVTPDGAPPDVVVSALQIETARRLGVRVWFENDLGMRFVLIPPGKFTAGSPESETGRVASEKQREVLIDAPFYMQTTELTNGQVRKLVPHHATQPWSGADTNADELAAGNMVPTTVEALTRLLSRREGRSFAVPTSAQWEYACRAGTTTARFWGETERGGERYANIAGQTAAERWPQWQTDPVRDGHAGPAPAGSMEPNPWGLREILGNVCELARAADGLDDWRGGSWPAGGAVCRAAASFDPTGAASLLGLRLVAPVSFQDRGPSPWPLLRPEGAPLDVLVSQLQIDEAAKLGVPVWFEDSIGLKFVLIPPGTWRIGAPLDAASLDADLISPRDAVIPSAFYLATTEVTNDQMRRVDPEWRSIQVAGAPCDDGPRPGHGVSSMSALRFAARLSGTDGRMYTIPTEEQWEYACRAGRFAGVRPWEGGAELFPRFGNLADASASAQFPGWTSFREDDGFAFSAEPASFLPNPWGLFDMTGNVQEWCRPLDGSDRSGAATLRGCSWSGGPGSDQIWIRVVARPGGAAPADRGIRLACDVPAPK